MEFKLPLLAVKDIKRSVKFYHDIFEQEVVLDLGINVTFSGGFAIQEDFAWLTGIEEEQIVEKSNNMELYFEVEDYDDFLRKLDMNMDINYVHKTKQHDWQQRVVRIYDPDFHIIEIGESMDVIVSRFYDEGRTIEQISQLIKSPIEYVETCLKNKPI